MNPSDTFDRILASLHEASFDDAHWPAASILIDKACRAQGNGLIVAEGDGNDARVLFAGLYRRGQRREDLERLYFDNYYPVDECVPRLRELSDSKVVHMTELYTQEELRTSSAYNEAMRIIGSQNGLMVRMDGPHGTRIVWGLADPVKPGGWGASQLQLVRRLLPHIRQFVRVRQAVARADATGRTLTDLLENTRVGIIHLDPKGRIGETNNKARNILRRGAGLFDRGGLLNAQSPSDNARLQRLLKRALPTSCGAPATGGSIAAQRPGALVPLVVHVSPVTAHQPDFGGRRVAALVLVVDPIGQQKIDPASLGATLGLTTLESQIAALLSEGKTVRQIATATGRQEGAVYWLLQQIYRKLGVSRQVDLVRLVLSL